MPYCILTMHYWLLTAPLLKAPLWPFSGYDSPYKVEGP